MSETAETQLAAAADGGTLSIKVQDSQNGEFFVFKVKKVTPFKKIIAAYAQKRGLSTDAVVLHYDGRRCNASETPQELQMEDGDVVDAMMHQLGGCLHYIDLLIK